MIKKFITILTGLIFISGCAMTARPNLPQSILPAEIDKKGFALIVGSLSRQNGAAIYNHWSINLRSTVHSPVQDIQIAGKASTAAPFIAYDFDYREKKFSGNLFAYLVPAGSYEFYDHFLLQQRGMYTATWRPKKGFSVPLFIQENTINYIGEYAATAEHFWKVGNNEKRDIEMLKQKYPNLDWTKLKINIPVYSTFH